MKDFFVLQKLKSVNHLKATEAGLFKERAVPFPEFVACVCQTGTCAVAVKPKTQKVNKPRQRHTKFVLTNRRFFR
jgi:hypothetical protein